MLNNVLVLCAHPDDELCCAGTVAKLQEHGATVHCAVFSLCEESIPEGFNKDTLLHEFSDSVDVLGMIPHTAYARYPVRNFPTYRQGILEDLRRLREDTHPDLVFVPSLSDIHQDHHVIAEEGLRAFKFCSVLGYELPLNTITFNHACFISLSEPHFQKKLDVMECYESQAFRPYMTKDFVTSLACVRGAQAGVALAEAFEVLRIKW